ncbi:MAG: XylR family transcriptional regulator [Planctomycetaceae bacterium]|nr:XylR family transcriptional regulator [Planctomycetaceae bacterium]
MRIKLEIFYRGVIPGGRGSRRAALVIGRLNHVRGSAGASPSRAEFRELTVSRRSVALLVETSNAYARGLLRGVIAYQREHGNWSVSLPEQQRTARPPAWLKGWRGDGIIARIETPEMAQALKRKKVPIIDVSAARHVPGIPWVETDDEAVARLAINHLAERGFRQLAFCGDSAFNWSRWRQDHFLRLAEEQGIPCEVYLGTTPDGSHGSWLREQKRMREWILQVPKPVGVLACYDIMAQRLLDVCREANIAVPDEVAVLGVDNDELLCDLANPSLSSVQLDARRTGYAAAELLERMMDGEDLSDEPRLIPPVRIATRNSTDVLAVEDSDIVAAWKFIREHACDGINVRDVLQQVPLSRRALETRFQAVVGRTPHQELTRLRIERVKELLRETEMSIAEIARSTGFPHVEYLSYAFKRATGMTPREFRRSDSEV